MKLQLTSLVLVALFATVACESKTSPKDKPANPPAKEEPKKQPEEQPKPTPPNPEDQGAQAQPQGEPTPAPAAPTGQGENSPPPSPGHVIVELTPPSPEALKALESKNVIVKTPAPNADAAKSAESQHVIVDFNAPPAVASKPAEVSPGPAATSPAPEKQGEQKADVEKAEHAQAEAAQAAENAKAEAQKAEAAKAQSAEAARAQQAQAQAEKAAALAKEEAKKVATAPADDQSPEAKLKKVQALKAEAEAAAETAEKAAQQAEAIKKSQEEGAKSEAAPKAEQPRVENTIPEGTPDVQIPRRTRLPALEADETRTAISVQNQRAEDVAAMTAFMDAQRASRNVNMDQLRKEICTPPITVEEFETVAPHADVKVVRLLGFALADDKCENVPARVDHVADAVLAFQPGQPHEVLENRRIALRQAMTAVAMSPLYKRAGKRLSYTSAAIDERIQAARSMAFGATEAGIFLVSGGLGYVAGLPRVGRALFLSGYEAVQIPNIGLLGATRANLAALGLKPETVSRLNLQRAVKDEFELVGPGETKMPGLQVNALDHLAGKELGEKRVVLVRWKPMNADRYYSLTSDPLPTAEAESIVQTLQSAAVNEKVLQQKIARYSVKRAAVVGGGTYFGANVLYFWTQFLGDRYGRAEQSFELLSMVPPERLRELNQP